jgi:hypothetical protein
MLLKLLRIVVFFALVVLLTEAVIAVASGDTGWVEKGVIVAGAAAVVAALPLLRRVGAR